MVAVVVVGDNSESDVRGCSCSSSGVRFGCDVDSRSDLPFPPQHYHTRSTMQSLELNVQMGHVESSEL
jgi:hypothetical protein